MIAIYARQSIDKKDSISIETQIETCKTELSESDQYKVYSDKGYSGSNTNRPQFQKLLKEIEAGNVEKIIVYKLDRISRSLLDFANIIDMLEKHKVEFMSMSEKFDTSSPMGKAMLGIVMVFAQLERETIQKRVKDNFYERGRQGLFLAGVAPLGFRKVPTVINGIKTHMLEAELQTAPTIHYIYNAYATGSTSIGSIIKEINENLRAYNLTKALSNVTVSRILRNPVYVRADADVYHYLKNKGAAMDDDISEYDGTRGCTVYGERKKKTTSKFTDLTGDHVKLNLHEGLVDADQWLRVQRKLDSNKQVKNSGKGSHSWLSGIAKCGYCELALTVVNGQKNGKRYVNCGGRKQRICYDRRKPLTFEDIEAMVEQHLLEHMRNYTFIQVERQQQNKTEINRLKIRLQEVETAIESIVQKMVLANETMAKYLNQEIEKLDSEKKKLTAELETLKIADSHEIPEDSIKRYIETWYSMSLEEKKAVAKCFLKAIFVKDDEISIVWLMDH